MELESFCSGDGGLGIEEMRSTGVWRALEEREVAAVPRFC